MPQEDKVSFWSVVKQYVFLWPSIRTYLVAWKSMWTEKDRKEEVVIIEEK